VSIAFVTQTTGSAASANNATATVSSTGGNLLVAFVSRSGGLGTGALTSVTDSASNTWTLATRGAVSGGGFTRIECWYAPNASAVTSITFNSATAQTYAWNVVEFSGVATSSPGDVFSPDNSGNASSTTQATPSISTGNANDLVICAIHYAQTTGTESTSGFTDLTNFDDGASGSGRAAYQIVSATGSYSVTWTLGVAKATGTISVSFKAAVVAAPDPFPVAYQKPFRDSQFVHARL
jgi:hypothetical protein